MVGVTGFEPATPRSRTVCSTRLSHTPTLSTEKPACLLVLITLAATGVKCRSYRLAEVPCFCCTCHSYASRGSSFPGMRLDSRLHGNDSPESRLFSVRSRTAAVMYQVASLAPRICTGNGRRSLPYSVRPPREQYSRAGSARHQTDSPYSFSRGFAGAAS